MDTEEIVRALAAQPWLEGNYCHFCGAEAPDLPTHNGDGHEATCLWLRAREWVDQEDLKAAGEKLFDATTGKKLDALVWFWFQTTRLPDETDDALRARCRAKAPFRPEPLTLETAAGRDLDAFAEAHHDAVRTNGESDESLRERCRKMHAESFPAP